MLWMRQMLPNTNACVIKLAPQIDSLPVSLAVTMAKKNLTQESGRTVFRNSLQQGNNQALLVQGCNSGWWLGTCSLGILSLLLSLHLCFKRAGKKSINGFLCLENGAAGLGCTCCAGAKLWVQIWKLLSEVPGSSSLSEHYLAVYMFGARSIAAVWGGLGGVIRKKGFVLKLLNHRSGQGVCSTCWS